jgi:hypothetical protein
MEHVFRVRRYQAPFYQAWVTGKKKRLIEIAHRRWGKDEIALNVTRQLALERPASYWHCLPEYAQARKALWTSVNPHTGKRRIDEAFPKEIRKTTNEQEMFIELVNGSTWQLIGSDRYDATVGSSPAGIVYSEWALANPSAWGYHRPMVQENNGWSAFITTPRGNNHAKTMYDHALKSDDWFAEVSSVLDTGALTEEQLTESLAEYQAIYGIDFGQAMFEQEYLCSFSGALIGAYFGAEMNKAEREDRIKPVDIDWEHPVHTVWDLGKTSNNPIGCFQVINNQPRWVDFYSPDSDDLRDWVNWLNDKGYQGDDFVPHDILVTEWGSKRTRFETLKEMGRKPRRLARVSVADGLQAARTTINASVIHSADDERGQRVEQWIEGCKNYRREWDDDKKTFRENPVKDWAEHIGSMTRYLGLAWKEVVPPQPKKEQPKELIYTANSDGSVTANMSVMDIVQQRMRKRRMEE